MELYEGAEGTAIAGDRTFSRRERPQQAATHLSFANWKIKDSIDLGCIGHSEPPRLRVVIFIC